MFALKISNQHLFGLITFLFKRFKYKCLTDWLNPEKEFNFIAFVFVYLKNVQRLIKHGTILNKIVLLRNKTAHVSYDSKTWLLRIVYFYT